MDMFKINWDCCILAGMQSASQGFEDGESELM